MTMPRRKKWRIAAFRRQHLSLSYQCPRTLSNALELSENGRPIPLLEGMGLLQTERHASEDRFPHRYMADDGIPCPNP